MTIAVFDPFSGASGDMLLGALVDAGAPLPAIQRELDKLGLPILLRSAPVEQAAVRGVRVSVDAADDATSRSWREIRSLIESSSLASQVKARALAIFSRLAEAEAAVHQLAVESVHFHEVGGLDAIADICGVAVALDLLGIDDVYCGPLRVGAGFVRAAHGLLPVPAPATAELLVRAQAPISTTVPSGAEPPGELLTPTGAAILTTIARFTPVQFTAERQGSGFGTRELPWPNALRVWIGSIGDEPAGELVIETNLDDMSPQLVEILMERLFASGALDVWVTSVGMKKNRPGFTVSALAPAARRPAIEDAFVANSTTLGVRAYPVDRAKAIRRIETVITRWGDVRVKLRGWHGRVIDVAPEYDDCARLAREADAPFREIWNEAHRFGEVFIGRRLNDNGGLG
jgi:uncharacterized protein (TIGR00299 family) protein